MIPAAFLSAAYESPTAQPAGARTRNVFDARPVAAVASVLALQVAAFGLAWDIVWHTFVGRDRFLTAPHVLMYAGVGFAGVTILAAVLYQSAHLRAGAQVPGTTPFLGIFHASRGLYVAGFGLLTTALAAPLDNSWHEWYGVDVTIWSPFHVMGLAGSAIALAGLLYVLAAVSNATHASARTVLGFDLYQWLGFLALAGGCALTYTLAQPGMREVPRVGFGPVGFLTAPVICALGMTLCASIAVVWTEAPIAGAAVIAIYFVRQGIFYVLAPALTRADVSAHGVAYRISGFEPHPGPLSVAIALTLLPAALFFALAGLRAVSRRGGAVAGALFALAVYVWVAAAQGAAVPLPGIAPPLNGGTLAGALLPTLALAAFAGMLAAGAGNFFGRLLRKE